VRRHSRTGEGKFGPITRFLVRRFTPEGTRRLAGAERRAAYGLLEGYVSIVLNTLLFGIKGFLGWSTGSIALIADAVHTLSDSVTSAIVIVGSYVSRRPADKEHPFGHGRAEQVATVIIAVLLGVAAIEFGKASIERIMSPLPVTAPAWAILVICGTIILKEWLSRFAHALAMKSGNSSLEADFWHHRSDVYATVLVVVAMLAGSLGYHTVDGVMGIGVSLFILKVAYDIAVAAVSPLVGQAPDPKEVLEVKRAALSVPGVRGVHDVVIHQYGDARFVSLHVEVSNTLTSDEMHRVSQVVEDGVSKGRHGSVCVHADPVNDAHPLYHKVLGIVSGLVQQDPDLDSFHDLRIVGQDENMNVVFDLKSADGCQDEEAAVQRIRDELARQLPGAGVVVEVEPRYSYQ